MRLFGKLGDIERMTNEKVKAVFQFYLEKLSTKSACLPDKLSDVESKQRDFAWMSPVRRGVAHLKYMCIEAQKFVDEGRIDKAMRWLGFLQGVLWSWGYFSLDDLKNHSRPDSEISKS